MKKALAGLACGLAVTACGTAAFAATGVLKSPYLVYPVTSSQPGTATSMEVLWQDNDTATDTIKWGTDTTYSMGTETSNEYNVTSNLAYGHQHAYTITGLQPDTKYYYEVIDENNSTYPGSFITAPDASKTHVKFLAQGDSRSVPFQLDALMQTMNQFYNYTPDQGATYPNAEYQRLSIANGDWVSTDGDKYWNAEWFMPTQQNVRAYTANVPINGVKGNHDNTSGYSASFPKYYPFPYPNQTAKTDSNTTSSTTYCNASSPTHANTSCTSETTCGGTVGQTNYCGQKCAYEDSNGNCTDSDGNIYYNNLYWSFDYGPVHFIMIDEYSTMTAGSAQYSWVQNDLANTTKPWKVMIYHEAAYSAGADGDNSTVRVFEPLITQYNVDLVFSGHSHNYARCGAYNLAQAGADTIALNVPHITSGGGGAPVYPVDLSNQHGWPHVITAWPATEFMTFDVEGNTLTMTAYEVAGLDVSNSKTDGSNTYVQSSGGSIVSPPANYPPTGLTWKPIETVVLNHFNNVSQLVSVTTSDFGYNRATKTYNGTMTITNNGAPLTGNVHVVLDGILNLGTATVPGVGSPDTDYFTEAATQGTEVPGPPASIIANNPAGGPSESGTGLISNVTLLNATGSNNGEPMIRAITGGMTTGQSVTIPLQFSCPTNGKITFNPVVLNEQN